MSYIGPYVLYVTVPYMKKNESHELLTPQEVAIRLRISVKHVYRMVEDAQLPAVWVGRRTCRIPAASVQEIVNSATR